METTDKKPAAPPYVSYKTLSNFLDRFKQGVPGRIDRGLMASMSGAAQSQVVTALRFLGMISENGLPTPLLRHYVSGEESERRNSLRATIRACYPFIFGNTFDLTSATAYQLREAFAQNTSATGETLNRCVAFFKDATADAGMIVSPYITQKQARTPGPRRRPSTARKEEKEAAERHMPLSPQTQAVVPAHSSLLLTGLFERLPKPGSVWPQEDRERWLQTLTHVLLLEYPEYQR